MKEVGSTWSHRRSAWLSTLLAVLLPTTAAFANEQLVLSRTRAPESTDYKGIVDIAVDPGFEASKVSIAVDGEHVLEALRSPYHVMFDLGPRVIQHKITITAWTKE